jgi:hypothetical protein
LGEGYRSFRKLITTSVYYPFEQWVQLYLCYLSCIKTNLPLPLPVLINCPLIVIQYSAATWGTKFFSPQCHHMFLRTFVVSLLVVAIV